MVVESQKVKDSESKRKRGEEIVRGMHRDERSPLRQTENSEGQEPTNMDSVNTGDAKRERVKGVPTSLGTPLQLPV